METLIAPAINLTLLVGILAYFLKEPAKAFVGNRHTSLRDELERVRVQLEQAQRRNQELSNRLSAIDAEIAALRDQARKDAEEARARIITESQRLSQIIITDAKASADTAFTDLRRQLRGELADKVLARAEHMIRQRMTPEDRTKIRQDFSQQLVNMPRQMESAR